ncbi:quinoprotein dehydrogenase-associated putative ABC transporter substrate-binding protein [Prosthecomicrobium sp. N25]|uniref:quinoprotein dehydrogenase-associated putative ABC transporter substrate-binding protein n=1 Tax=Prosthecomicrobium sp. N25 TaxID=3129254 RepID=UPI0030771875
MRRSRAAAILLAGPLAAPARAEALRVCADPNNLPFSNEAREGFENRIAAVVAEALGRELAFTWWAQRRGFVRNTLAAGLCDVAIGVPAGYDPVATTRPYYRSTYVLVSRSRDKLDAASLDDPRLDSLRIGVQLVGDDGANTPPAHALAALGLGGNLRGYMVTGDYGTPAPGAAIVDAVAAGEVDVAAVWGPQAGYFAARAAEPLTVMPIAGGGRSGPFRFQFDIAMGVRRGDRDLRDRLDHVLVQRRADIEAILEDYHVPLLPLPPAGTAAGARPD